MASSKEIAVVREAVGKIVQILAGRGIEVTQRGTSAFVQYDKNTHKPKRVNIPYIPDNATPELLAAIHGFLDHEVGHLLFSDFEVLAKSMKEGKSVGGLTNIFEDTFIERQMAKRFLGSDYNLDRVRDFFLKKYVTPAVNEALGRGDMNAVWRALQVPAVRAWAGQSVFKDYMKDKWPLIEKYTQAIGDDLIERVAKINSTADSLEIAREARKRLVEAFGSVSAPIGDPDSDKEGDGDGEPEEEGAGAGKAGGGESSKGRKKSKKASREEDEDSESKPEKSKAEKAKGAGEEKEEEDEDEKGSGEEKKEEGEDDKDDDSTEPRMDTFDHADESEEEEKDDVGEDDADDEEESDELEEDDSDEETPDESEEDDDEESDEEEEEDGESKDEGADSDENAGASDDEVAAGPAPFDEEDLIANEDFDDSVSKVITAETGDLSRAAPYLIYTKDYDLVETFPVPRDFRDEWFKELDEQTNQMVGTLQKNLERLIFAKSLARWHPGLRKGRLHSSSLYRLKAGDTRVFRRKEEGYNKDVAVSLVVDCSGSMAGNKFRTAMISAYALSSVLDRLRITHEVIGFTTRSLGAIPRDVIIEMKEEEARIGRGFSRWEPLYMPVFKHFHERLMTVQRKRFAAAKYRAFLANNVDGECVEIAALRLARRKEKGKFMFVLSDGFPCADGNVVSQRAHLKHIVGEVDRMGIKIIGIGIMDDAVRYYYPKWVVLNEVDELPNKLMNELRAVLLGS